MSLETEEPVVVVLALSSVSRSDEEKYRVLRRLLGRQFEGGSLFDLQMEIARKTADFGPVLLLATDQDTLAVVREECRRYEICELLRTGKIRVSIVSHQGEWIRDYGPQFGVSGDGDVVVINARYHEKDLETNLWTNLQQVSQMRKAYLERLMRMRSLAAASGSNGLDSYSRREVGLPIVTDDSGLEDDSTSGDESSAAEEISHMLAHRRDPSADEIAILEKKVMDLREWSDLLSNGAVFQRYGDEHVAYSLADSVLKTPEFRLYRSPIALDGGNIFHFANDECISSRDLINENDGLERRVRLTLGQYYSCKKIHYLHPLPGPGVIKHADMFLLPVGGKKVLLAWYDPTAEPLRSYWSQLTAEQKSLILEAAIAMRKNEQELKHAGYEVLHVPALPPEIEGDSVVYKTVLNALVRTNASGRKQVLMPYYANTGPKIQDKALAILKEAFGPNSEVVQIEATKAAKRQGAIHCLTLAIPERLSLFADPEDQLIREAISTDVDALEEQLVKKLDYSIEGTWVDDDEAENAQSITFTKDILAMADDEGDGVLKYEVYHKNTREWYLLLHDDEAEETPSKIFWEDADHIKLEIGTKAPHDFRRATRQSAKAGAGSAVVP